MGGPSGIAAMFPRLGPSGFLDGPYPHRPHHEHGDVSRLGELATVPELDDVPALVALQPDHDGIFCFSRDASGRAQQESVPKHVALERYRAGSTVEIRLSPFVPEAGRWCDVMRQELGFRPDQPMVGDLFLSPRGEATPKHYDASDVFVVQLRGRKRWRIAQNKAVPHPASAFIAGFGTDLRYLGAGGFDRDHFSREMPADSEIIDLEPGSALFLPRGWWHETEALTPSISMTVVTRAPDAGDLVKAQIALAQAEHSAWRQGLSMASEAGVAAARAHVIGLLEQLIGDLRRLDGLGLQGSSRLARPVVRAEGVRLTSSVVGEGPSWLVRVEHPASEPRELFVPPSIGELVRWIGGRDGGFTAAELSAQPGAPPRQEVEQVLLILLEHRVLRWADA
jgi:50S ribosomal protein L16 3-hydroxylase